MSKIFRTALLVFATTFGIGLYALIGAPVLRINYGSLTTKAGGALAGVGSTVLKIIPSAHFLLKSGAITYALTLPSNDLPSIKKIILDDEFGAARTREIIFTQKGVPTSGVALLEYFSGAELYPELREHLKDARYFVQKKDEPEGILFIATTGAEFVYPALLKQENQFTAPLLALTHPKLSPSEIRMLATLKFVSRNINGLDARAITNSADIPILIWALDGDMLVIAGNKESFTAATKK